MSEPQEIYVPETRERRGECLGIKLTPQAAGSVPLELHIKSPPGKSNFMIRLIGLFKGQRWDPQKAIFDGQLSCSDLVLMKRR